MAAKKHYKRHSDIVEYMKDSGWDSHPYVRESRAKQSKPRQRTQRKG